MPAGIIKTAIDAGLSLGVFALCVWLVVTIVRRLCGTMDRLVTKLDRFTDRVRDEHNNGAKQHEKMMLQHEGIMATIAKIRGFQQAGGE